MLLRHAWLPITAQPRETLKPETYCFVVYHTSQPVHKVKIQRFGTVYDLIL